MRLDNRTRLARSIVRLVRLDLVAHGIPFVTFVTRGIVLERVALIALSVNRVVTIEFSRMIKVEPDDQHRFRSTDAMSSVTQLFLRSVAWQCPSKLLP
jgi:hypothetical protein